MKGEFTNKLTVSCICAAFGEAIFQWAIGKYLDKMDDKTIIALRFAALSAPILAFIWYAAKLISNKYFPLIAKTQQLSEEIDKNYYGKILPLSIIASYYANELRKQEFSTTDRKVLNPGEKAEDFKSNNFEKLKAFIAVKMKHENKNLLSDIEIEELTTEFIKSIEIQ